MSSLKRKEGPGGPSTSKSPKRPKSNDIGVSKGKEGKSTKGKSVTEKPAPPVSLLTEDEPLFPRGGGSVLTPLEQQEIQVQAKKDALFEEQSVATGGKGEKGGKKKKRKSEAGETPAADPDAVKIESLNFKVCASYALSRAPLV